MNKKKLRYKEVQRRVGKKMKQHRKSSKEESDKKLDSNNRVLFTEIRRGIYENEYSKRLVLFLKGTGCVLATETGGCTFCGFYNATNFGVKINEKNYLDQVKNVLNDRDINFNELPVICLYNDGSLLREEEISFDTLLEIISLVNEKDSIKKITLEARVEDITEEKLYKLKNKSNKEIEIAVGFESGNSEIRDLCINKSFENSTFEEKCILGKRFGISIIPLMLLKPPFLTEKEAIEDYVDSLMYLERLKLKRIDMELMTIEKHTLVYDLWKKEIYSPPKLWSVIEVLKRRQELKLITPLYISPASYSVPAEAKASNYCRCDQLINEHIEDFNKNGNINEICSFKCSCKKDWDKLIQSEDFNSGLVERIEDILNMI